MNKKILFLTLLFVITGFFYYQWTEPIIPTIQGNITRIIDGDTLELEYNTTIRLIGINTPEKNKPYYQQAKEKLQTLALHKEATIQTTGKDQYQRTLGHLFINNQHINEKLLQEGLATLYYYEKDIYHNKLMEAEKQARITQQGLWKQSNHYGCIELIKIKYEETQRCTNNEQLTIKNNCEKTINITIKDDARHEYQKTIIANNHLTMNFSCIFNNAGDSIYIRDDKGLLMFYRY